MLKKEERKPTSISEAQRNTILQKKYEPITRSDVDTVSKDIRYNGASETNSYVYFPNSRRIYQINYTARPSLVKTR